MTTTFPYFISADDLVHLTSLSVEDAPELKFLIYRNGWVNASYADLSTVRIYVEGFFPAKLKEFKRLPRTDSGYWIPPHKYTFTAYFSSKYANFDITKSKREQLFFSEDGDLEDISFIFDSYCDTVNHFKINDVYISYSDLFDFCKKEGIFDIQKKLDTLIQTKSKPALITSETNTDQQSLPILHQHTSQSLLDLLEANDKFWSLYDPEDPSTAPTKALLVNWFLEKGHSKTLAGRMDTILREGRNHPGGRPNS
nr:hypothetical protein [uncultured Amphritea sp.]